MMVTAFSWPDEEGGHPGAYTLSRNYFFPPKSEANMVKY